MEKLLTLSLCSLQLILAEEFDACGHIYTVNKTPIIKDSTGIFEIYSAQEKGHSPVAVKYFLSKKTLKKLNKYRAKAEVKPEDKLEVKIKKMEEKVAQIAESKKIQMKVSNIFMKYPHDNIKGIRCQKPLVMELCEERTLLDEIKRLEFEGRHFHSRFLAIATQFGNMLEYFAEHQIIHHGIQPSNICYKYEGTKIELIDFPLAEHSKISSRVLGTGNYRAPEIASANNHNSKVDVYSVGATLYMMIYHKPAKFDKNGKVLFPNNNEENDLIRNCMESKPEDRIDYKQFQAQVKDLKFKKPCKGDSLAKIVSIQRKEKRYYRIPMLLRIIDHLSDRLLAFGRRGVISHGIKPENLCLIDNHGRLQVIDSESQEKTETSTSMMEDSAYRAPEMTTGSHDNKVDIFSAGVTLFELIFSKKPIFDESHKVIFPEINPGMDHIKLRKSINDWIQQCLEHNPEDRIDYRRFDGEAQHLHYILACNGENGETMSKIILKRRRQQQYYGVSEILDFANRLGTMLNNFAMKLKRTFDINSSNLCVTSAEGIKVLGTSQLYPKTAAVDIDIQSLGLIIFEMAFLQKPEFDENGKIIFPRAHFLSDEDKNVINPDTHFLQTLIEDCLRMDYKQFRDEVKALKESLKLRHNVLDFFK